MLEKFLTDTSVVTRAELASALQTIADTLLRLDSKLKGLQANAPRGFQYRGTWDASESYDTGDFATHAGGLWAAKSASVGSRPGDGSGSWQLAVKRGGDAPRGRP
jgi:hypothetical protein